MFVIISYYKQYILHSNMYSKYSYKRWIRMSLDLVRETVKENRVVSRESVQIVIENDLIVPDTKPDINKILFAEGDAFIVNNVINDSKVLMEGAIRYKILYIEDSSEYNVQALNMDIDFEHDMDMAVVREGMEGWVKCDVEHIECRVVNGRKLNVRAILRVKLKITEENEYYFINDVEEGENEIQILRSNAEIRKFIGRSQDVCTIKETLEIPSGNPSIKEIFRSDVKIVNIEYRITDGKVIIEGVGNIQTLYAGDDKERSIKFVEHESNFTHVLDLHGLYEGMEVQVDYEVQDYTFEPTEDEDGELRLINGEIHIAILAFGSVKEETTVIADVYGLRTDLKLENIRIGAEELIIENKKQTVVKETLSAEDDHPEISEILNIFSRPILLEYEVRDNLINVEGLVENYVLCCSNSLEEPIFCWNQKVPISESIEIQSTDEDESMVHEIDFLIEHSSYSMLHPKDVELRLVTNIISKSYKKTEGCFVEKVIEITDSAAEDMKTRVKKPDIALYFVQEGDSLWSIAKKYKTTMEDIVRENKIEDENLLSPGTQVLIV